MWLTQRAPNPWPGAVLLPRISRTPSGKCRARDDPGGDELRSKLSKWTGLSRVRRQAPESGAPAPPEASVEQGGPAVPSQWSDWAGAAPWSLAWVHFEHAAWQAAHLIASLSTWICFGCVTLIHLQHHLLLGPPFPPSRP